MRETIDIIIDDIDSDYIDGIPKSDFKHLTLATTKSVFVSNGIYYKQIDGVAIGSPLGPTLAIKKSGYMIVRQNLNLSSIGDMLTIFFFYLNLLSMLINVMNILILNMQI